MPSYASELDTLLMRKQAELQRELLPEEVAAVCIGLVEDWFARGKLDELIRVLLKEFAREGGSQEISTFARLLFNEKDEVRLHALFEGLTSRRVKAYREWLPRAQTGHIGSMSSAAHALAAAMDIQVEYCVWLHKLAQTNRYEAVRAQMLDLLRTPTDTTARSKAKSKVSGSET